MQRDLLPDLNRARSEKQARTWMDQLSDAPEGVIIRNTIFLTANVKYFRELCQQVIIGGNYGLMRKNGAIVVVDKKVFLNHAPKPTPDDDAQSH